jgi:hypothetical protein
MQVGIILVFSEGFEMVERPPVLHDRWQSHLIRQQTLLGVLHEVREHLAHALARAETTEFAEITNRADWMKEVDSGTDQEDDEVPVNLCSPTALFDLGHPTPP